MADALSLRATRSLSSMPSHRIASRGLVMYSDQCMVGRASERQRSSSEHPPPSRAAPPATWRQAHGDDCRFPGRRGTSAPPSNPHRRFPSTKAAIRPKKGSRAGPQDILRTNFNNRLIGIQADDGGRVSCTLSHRPAQSHAWSRSSKLFESHRLYKTRL